MTSLKNKRNGFTLIELLLVAAIISLLLSIGVSYLGEAKANAQISRFKQDFAQIQVAISLYRNENGRWPEAISNANTGQDGKGGSLSDLVVELFNAGTYNTETVIIPPMISEDGIYLGGTSNVATCGSAYGSDPYAYVFAINNASYYSEFPLAYKNAFPEDGLGCFQIQ